MDALKPKRRRLNAPEKRALKAAGLQKFVDAYARKAGRGGLDPNDRKIDHDVERSLKHLKPEDLDQLLRDDED